MTRRVYQMIELTQRRCDLRFGVGACEAEGTPKCYQTWKTCKFREAYNLAGVFRWRFVPEGQTLRIPYESAGANDITGHAIPRVKGIRKSPTRLNIGAIRSGETPFGVRSSMTVNFSEFAGDDRDGDFYLGDRVDLPRAGFWQKFLARVGDAVAQLEARHYVWYEGQTLSEAVVSRFDVRELTVNADGAVLQCDDPLQRVEFQKAQFPKASGGELQADISDSTTSINVFGMGDEIGADYGNTGSRRYLRIGSEIIEYTGWTDAGDFLTLTGVTRAVGNTEAEDHEAGETVQRVGRYERILHYRAALDMLENHSTVTADLIDFDRWEEEGDTFLPIFQTDAWVTDPEDVSKLIGELCRDGLFHVWWDERAQKITMQASRPPFPDDVTAITQARNVMRSQFSRKGDDRLTRIICRFGPRDPFSDAPENYRVVRVRIDVDAEGPFAADGTIREKVINSRWITTNANARILSHRLLRRYNVTPQYATITLDAKDAALNVGDTISLITPNYADSEGRPLESRWEIISWDQDYRAGTVDIRVQESPYEGRFAVWMPDGAPDYLDTPVEDRDPAGFFSSAVTETMSNGDPPYKWW